MRAACATVLFCAALLFSPKSLTGYQYWLAKGLVFVAAALWTKKIMKP